MIRKKIRKAMKDHNCISCDDNIEQGEKYLEVNGEDGYNFWTVRFCKKCSKVKIT